MERAEASECVDRDPETEVRTVYSVLGEQFDNERHDLDIRHGTGRWTGCRQQAGAHLTLWRLSILKIHWSAGLIAQWSSDIEGRLANSG